MSMTFFRLRLLPAFLKRSTVVKAQAIPATQKGLMTSQPLPYLVMMSLYFTTPASLACAGSFGSFR